MRDTRPDPDTEWLDHVRPTGLVVAAAILKELGVTPLRQTALDSAAVQAKLADNLEAPALADPWAFARDILGWPASKVCGAPGGPAIPDALCISVGEHSTVLAPDWAVRVAGASEGWQLLAQTLPAGTDPDQRAALEGWEASAHQRFERLLRETQVFTGVLIADQELRLIHAPAAETSGWLSFPLRELGNVAGRPMLAGLKLLLNAAALFTNPENKRLPALLKRSREAQASVSQELAGQVLGALHELLRGLRAAEPGMIESLAHERPGHVYEGLLTVLMRLVFILYAEDRDLLPSHTGADARGLYDANYSVRGLFARLCDDEAQNPDTMDERLGGWGQLLALFRLIHGGDRSGWIVGRGGKLFDPEVFPFIEGRNTISDRPRVPQVSDGCLLRLLRGLMTLRGERLSYRTLDVEQIGSVYETVMGFTVTLAKGPSLAIKAGKNNRTPVFVDCAALAALAAGGRQKFLKDECDRAQLPAGVAAALRSAIGVDGIVLALANVVDQRGSPDGMPVGAHTPILQPTDERRRTGSHYTPRTLTEPIVRQALAPAFERLGPKATPAQILDLRICDLAMGSGAFLVEACRQLGGRLVKAWASPGPRPEIPPDEDEELHARRLVAQRCLYGVDKNPMATDLARLSLWLATLARDHEFTFLDHALKTGDSLVGLTRAQIAAAHWDTSRPGLTLLRGLVRDRIDEALRGRAEIQSAPDDVTRAIQETRHRHIEARVEGLRQTGDAVVAAFFSSEKQRDRETRRAEVESWFTGGSDVWRHVATATAALQQGRHPVQPFHWEIEFPEIFTRTNPGFDAVVGNPPFAGKNTMLASHRVGYLGWLKTIHYGAHGNADLVAHFFRRAWGLIRDGGAFGLIATNTVGQGDTRETGLATIMQSGARIFSALRRLPWPGEAAVVVSVVHVARGAVAMQPMLDDRPVRRISAYLVEGDLDASPKRLAANADMAFQGSIILGMGFTFDDDGAGAGVGQPTALAEMHRLVESNPRNRERIFPYIGGEEVNNDPRQAPNRYVIDLSDLNESEARANWPDLMEIVEKKVRPERDEKDDKGNASDWWRFLRPRGELRAAVAGMPRVLAISRVTEHMAFCMLEAGAVFSDRLVIFPNAGSLFAPLSSRVHEIWVRTFASTFEDRLNYSHSDCFETFPLPFGFDDDQALVLIGETYRSHRAAMMSARNIGLTPTYNRFHNAGDREDDIVELRRHHDEMDRLVLLAYGWDDLAAAARAESLSPEIEDDPKYRDRLFWPSPFRAEVLSRLLDLNAQREAAEAASGAVVAPAGRARQRSRTPGSRPTLV